MHGSSVPNPPDLAARSSSPPVLIFLDGSCRGREIELRFDGIVLGRSRSCTVPLDPEIDRFVSARHALISHDSHGWWIEDLGSTNGTWCLRLRLRCRTKIQPDDEFTLGRPNMEGSVRFHVRFRDQRPSPPSDGCVTSGRAELDATARPRVSFLLWLEQLRFRCGGRGAGAWSGHCGQPP